MKINSADTVAGLPIIKVRDFLRKEPHDAWTLDYVSDALEVSPAVAKDVVQELEANGFLVGKTRAQWHGEHVAVQGADRDDVEALAWATTVKGNALGMASAAPSVKRSTAERVLEEFLGRVNELVDRDEYLYRVKRVVLFGSMLDLNRQTVNDIDLVVELEAKEPDKELSSRLDRDYAAARIAEGRHFSNYVDQLFAAQHDTLKFLRKRSRLLKFHRLEGEVWQEAEHRLIYPAS